MDAVTYPNRKVADFLKNRVIPLQLKSDAEPYATDYGVKWTPNLLIIDSEGKEHHRVVGFLPPVHFIASLLLGIGKGCFDLGNFKEAIEYFDQVISEFPSTGSAPEAIFYRGISQYKNTHKPDGLKKAFQALQEKYPDSDWAKSAYPYWQLP